MARQKNYSLEQAFYPEPGVLDLDMRQIFYREWLFAIPACEIPKAGNYRDPSGGLLQCHHRARHRWRSARLPQRLPPPRLGCLQGEERQLRPKLVCPYHQWTYELDGSLLWARDMGPNFDASKHGLKPVNCRDL